MRSHVPESFSLTMCRKSNCNVTWVFEPRNAPQYKSESLVGKFGVVFLWKNDKLDFSQQKCIVSGQVAEQGATSEQFYLLDGIQIEQ